MSPSPEPNMGEEPQEFDGSEAVGRVAVRDAHLIEYRSLAELHTALSAICSRHVAAAKALYINDNGVSEAMVKLSDATTEMHRCTEVQSELPRKSIGTPNGRVVFNEIGMQVIDFVHRARQAAVHAIYRRKGWMGDPDPRLGWTEQLDLFDYTAHYFSIYGGTCVGRLMDKTTQWKRADARRK